jgi:MFS family permease
MLELAPLLVSALILGLLGGGHCLGMCGGLMGALTLAIPKEQRSRRFRLLLAYNLGRIFSYATAGLLIGLAGWAVANSPAALFMRVLAGLLLIAMGLYLAGWWSGLTRIERLGRGLWRYIQPVANRLLPVSSLPRALRRCRCTCTSRSASRSATTAPATRSSRSTTASGGQPTCATCARARWNCTRAAGIGTAQPVSQLHLGGGSPTFLSDAELGELMAMLRRNFALAAGAECRSRSTRAPSRRAAAGAGRPGLQPHQLRRAGLRPGGAEGRAPRAALRAGGER